MSKDSYWRVALIASLMGAMLLASMLLSYQISCSDDQAQANKSDEQRHSACEAVPASPYEKARDTNNGQDEHSVAVVSAGIIATLLWKVVTDPVVIITGLLAFFTFELWRSTKDLVERTDNTNKTHERAYVFASPRYAGDEPEYERLAKGWSKPYGRKIRLFVENFGRTPAKMKTVQWGLCPEGELPEVPNWGQGTKVYNVLHPNQEKVPTKAEPLIYRFDWKESHAVFARVEYEDVFRVTHSSGFLLRIVKDGKEHFAHHPLADERYSRYWEWD